MELLTDEQRGLLVHGGRIDDYEVLKPIGKGKFSVVYKAKRRRDDITVALKKISIFDLMDNRAREKTLKEVRLVQSVSHENIVQYIDAFLDNKELYIAFEWAEAGDLKRQIRKANEKGVHFDERTIWRYFTQLCAAILHLHRQRIMHRDLKPANIFLTLQGIVKVGDLGLGRHLSEDTLEARSKVGTPLYMSPEVLRGESYDWKSDVWSLGCILYELAMLRSPFKSEGLNLYGLFQKINKGDYESVPNLYSSHLRSLVTRMISLAASDRPTMEQVWADCQARPSTASLEIHRQKKLEQHPDFSDPRKLQTEASRPSSSTSSTVLSRPVSQQSEGRSRPPSNEKCAIPEATDEEVKHRTAEMKMDLLYERLLMFQYDKITKRPITRQHFLPRSTVLPSSNTQFQDMCKLIVWLLKMIATAIGLDSHFIDASSIKGQQPIVVAQMLLLDMERVGVPSVSTVSALSLTHGAGSEVCILLEALSVKVEEVTQSTRSLPVYIHEDIDIYEPDDLEYGELQDETGESTTSMSYGWKGLGGTQEHTIVHSNPLCTQWLVVHEPDLLLSCVDNIKDEDDDGLHMMIQPRVDPLAWQREVEIMSGKLMDECRLEHQNRVSKLESMWQTRLEKVRRYASVLTTHQQITQHILDRVRAILEVDHKRLKDLELTLNAQLTTQCQIYRDFQEQLTHHVKVAHDQQTKVDEAIKILNQVMENERLLALDSAALTSKLGDNSLLFQIKDHMSRLQVENREMQMRLQVARKNLLEQQQQSEQRRQYQI